MLDERGETFRSVIVLCVSCTSVRAQQPGALHRSIASSLARLATNMLCEVRRDSIAYVTAVAESVEKGCRKGRARGTSPNAK